MAGQPATSTVGNQPQSRALVPTRKPIAKASPNVRTRSRSLFERLFGDQLTEAEARLDAKTFFARFRRLRRIVVLKAYIALGLTFAIVLTHPLFGTHHAYFSRSPDGKFGHMTALTMPNMTHQALLSWVTTSVTEVMTYNFANFNQEIAKHQNRFLPDTWKDFVSALLQDDMLKKFQRQELVLTTAPTGAAVVVSEGVEDDRYQWVVQLPVILNYATNNNRSVQKNSVIELTVVRVPTTDNPSGLGITVWNAKPRKENEAL